MRQFKKTILFCLVGVVLAGVLGFAVLFTMNQWTGDTKPMIAVADRFVVPADWKLVSERIEPPRRLCVNDIPCPSMGRTWRLPNIIDKNEFESFIGGAGLSQSSVRDCEFNPLTSGRRSFCRASGVIDGYKVEVGGEVNPERLDSMEVSITVKEIGK